MRKSMVALLVCGLLTPAVAHAVITFTQLDDDIFVISHRIKVIGSRAKAMRMVYEKAASVCVAAGFSYFQILEQESEAAQEDDAGNASVRVQFFHEDGPDRIDCEKNASAEYVMQARNKLAKQGYVPPDPAGEPAPATGSSAAEPRDCSIEQIAAMARAGLADEQIRAACAETSGEGDG